MSEFHKIWTDQCAAAEDIRERFGVNDALRYLVGEKLLLFFSVSSVAQNVLSTAIFSTGFLLVPLLAHFVFTAAISLSSTRLRIPYPLALIVGAILHSIYNYMLLGGLS